MTPVTREILLSFWKVHILHHAASGPIYGLWLLNELAEHGHKLSPGTLYPILARMQRNGWLRATPGATARARRYLRITPAGQAVLEQLREFITQLHEEVVIGPNRRAPVCRGRRPAAREPKPGSGRRRA
ncbi:MAG: helix-turn-helix transcriptional regulator [Candidatus Wallbacteria bacterium]|nr:helix-turn-helix transcriptional regulator [Candidatus Wallbacteria bacterium]